MSDTATLGQLQPGGSGHDLLARIRGFIEVEGLMPGMRLPAERNLAVRLQVSRPAIRETLKALSMLGVVETKRSDGTYIKSLEALPLAVAARPIEVNYDLVELLEVRRMIEPRAAALAAARASDRQLAEIEKLLRIQEASLDDIHMLVEHDYLFHEAILRAAGNRVLFGLVRALAGPLRESRSITARTTPDVPSIIRQHRTIFNAIRTGQSELAEQAMIEHLQRTGIDLISEKKR